MPSFIDYLEFCTFLPSVSVGPGFQYIDWTKYNNHHTTLANPTLYIVKMYIMATVYAGLDTVSWIMI